MKREFVSREYLKQWLTSEIQKREGCANCRFGGITPLKVSDETGCNWSSSIHLSCSGTPSNVCTPHAQELLLVARNRFNLGSKRQEG